MTESSGGEGVSQIQPLKELLPEFRQARAEEPQFYYNELADRARAAGRLRPLLENFLAGRTSFAEFKSKAAGESRSELYAARGRKAGRYWRLNAAGRLFLESLYKAAERAGRVNSAGLALQAALKAPATLDGAGQKFEAFDFFRGELNASGVQAGAALNQGFVPYVLSIFWSLQQPEWPVYEREVRTELEKLGLLDRGKKSGRSSGDNYSRFYLAFNRLSLELALNTWELESFLHWLARRNFSPAALLVLPSKAARAGLIRRASLEKLKLSLEPRLKTGVAAGLRGRNLSSERLVFGEPERPLWLEIRLEEGEVLAGVGFEGLNPAVLQGESGQNVLRELRGFLQDRPRYRFYQTFPASDQPLAENITGEFWLLCSFNPASKPVNEPELGTALLDEWRLLYPFARRLLAPFEDTPASSGIRLPQLNYQLHSESAVRDRAGVAEEREFYQGAPAGPLAPGEPENEFSSDGSGIGLAEGEPAAFPSNLGESEPLDPEPTGRFSTRPEAEEAARRAARFAPPPLSEAQVEAITAFVRERLAVEPGKIRELLTHLEAGRSILLYGPPGTGKTRLARLLAGQLGSPDPGWASEMDATNYSLATAGPEWSSYDVIGGIRPGLASDKLVYYFEPGVVARAALECEASLARSGRPHHLIIDEFNRANQERAFGELFTVLEYRDRPLLPGERLGRPSGLYMPEAFRIIGTMNSEDRNTLYEVGMALRRRFALVELDLPSPEEERRFLPKALKARFPSVEVIFAPNSRDEFKSPDLQNALESLTAFAAAVRPEPGKAGKKLGTAPLIEALLFCAVAARYYSSPDEALEDAILANLLPQLERSPQAAAKALVSFSPGGPLAGLGRVKAALESLSGSAAFYKTSS